MSEGPEGPFLVEYKDFYFILNIYIRDLYAV